MRIFILLVFLFLFCSSFIYSNESSIFEPSINYIKNMTSSFDNYKRSLIIKRNIGVGLFIPGVILNSIGTPIWIYTAVVNYGYYGIGWLGIAPILAFSSVFSVVGLIMVIVGIPLWIFFQNKYNRNISKIKIDTSNFMYIKINF